MKPNFALSLSFKGIRLLRRSAGGWRTVGEVAVGSDDFDTELATLRKSATALDAGGLRTKLLLPPEQVKYLTIATPGMSDEDRRVAARDALKGATPYALSDLAFDISIDGHKTHIAAVARETLAEAEAFAVEHRFHPVSFATIPRNVTYLGEPFFGETSASADLLEDGEKVEPDGIAVIIVGDGTVPEGPVAADHATPPTVTDVESPALEPDAASTLAETQLIEPNDDAAPRSKAEGSDERLDSQISPADDDAAVAGRASQPVIAMPATEAEASVDTIISPAEVRSTPTPGTDAPGPKVPTVKKVPYTGSSATSDPDLPPEIPPAVLAARLAARKKDVPAAVRPAPQVAPLPPLDTSPPPPKLPPLGGARDRKEGKVVRLAGGAPDPGQGEAGFASRRSNAPSRTTPRAEPKVTLAAATAAGGKTADSNEAAPMRPDSTSLNPPAGPVSPADGPAETAARDGFLSRRRGKSSAPRKKVITAEAAPMPAVNASSEEERMTIFGARSADVGGKPRFLGLMLTAALLVFLAGVAAWASVFLDDGLSLARLFGNRSTPEMTAAPAPESVPVPTLDLTEPTVPETEPVRQAAIDPALSVEDAAVLDALRDRAEPTERSLSEAELEAKYAATGIWSRAPDVPPEPAALIELEDVYLASIDPVSTASDAIALPVAADFVTDVSYDSVSNPASAGMRFALDDNGLVIPTEDGALSPDGILVYRGSPPATPPATLARFEPDANADAASEAAPSLPALAGVRPQVRPGDLVENAERAQFDGLTRGELASYRPVLRPQSLQEEAAAAAASVVAPDDTEAAVAAALEETTPSAFVNATRFATEASRRPDTRPSNFASIVQRAERTETQDTRVASAAPVAPRVVTPSIPSKTSVAKQATMRNAINLRQVNLIGVYGKPSNRRALVRLGNGRYEKVVVGDRLDGGRVSAIGDSELRYTKRGRSVVLKMPR